MKRWIGYTARPRGVLVLDSGARQAVEKNGSSLLAIGVTEVEGAFGKGDVVALHQPRGIEFARGLTNYTSEEVERIRGSRTERIEELLGHCPYHEVVHRDNMALTKRSEA